MSTTFTGFWPYDFTPTVKGGYMHPYQFDPKPFPTIEKANRFVHNHNNNLLLKIYDWCLPILEPIAIATGQDYWKSAMAHFAAWRRQWYCFDVCRQCEIAKLLACAINDLSHHAHNEQQAAALLQCSKMVLMFCHLTQEAEQKNSIEKPTKTPKKSMRKTEKKRIYLEAKDKRGGLLVSVQNELVSTCTYNKSQAKVFDTKKEANQFIAKNGIKDKYRAIEIP